MSPQDVTVLAGMMRDVQTDVGRSRVEIAELRTEMHTRMAMTEVMVKETRDTAKALSEAVFGRVPAEVCDDRMSALERRIEIGVRRADDETRDRVAGQRHRVSAWLVALGVVVALASSAPGWIALWR